MFYRGWSEDFCNALLGFLLLGVPSIVILTTFFGVIYTIAHYVGKAW